MLGHGVEQVVVAGVDVGIDEHDRQPSVVAGAGQVDALLREGALQRLVCLRGGVVLEQPEVGLPLAIAAHANDFAIGEIGNDAVDVDVLECIDLLELLGLQIQAIQRIELLALAHAGQVHGAIVAAEAPRQDGLVAEACQLEAVQSLSGCGFQLTAYFCASSRRMRSARCHRDRAASCAPPSGAMSSCFFSPL